MFFIFLKANLAFFEEILRGLFFPKRLVKFVQRSENQNFTSRKPTTFMNQQERQLHENLLRNYFLQIHLTVIMEADFAIRLGGKRALQDYRDGILDNINRERRLIGYI